MCITDHSWLQLPQESLALYTGFRKPLDLLCIKYLEKTSEQGCYCPEHHAYLPPWASLGIGGVNVVTRDIVYTVVLVLCATVSPLYSLGLGIALFVSPLYSLGWSLLYF